jgi:hypothetical protein
LKTIDRKSQAATIDSGDFQSAERLVAIALSGNLPSEIAAELKDLFVQINLPQYCERQGLYLNLHCRKLLSCDVKYVVKMAEPIDREIS